MTKGYTQTLRFTSAIAREGIYPDSIRKFFIVGRRANNASLPPSYVLTARFALPLWVA
jgi:hypothetical protein